MILPNTTARVSPSHLRTLLPTEHCHSISLFVVLFYFQKWYFSQIYGRSMFWLTLCRRQACINSMANFMLREKEKERQIGHTYNHDWVNNSKFRWFHSTFNRFGFSGQEKRLSVFQCFSDTCMETKAATSNLNPHDVDPDDPFDLKKSQDVEVRISYLLVFIIIKTLKFVSVQQCLLKHKYKKKINMDREKTNLQLFLFEINWITKCNFFFS